MFHHQIEAGITRFVFDPRPGTHFGFNILAIEHENRVLLIDTAFEAQAAEVLRVLNAWNMSPEKAIISHFHDDHIYGLKSLPRMQIYGSSLFQTTLELWTKKEDHPFFFPTLRSKTHSLYNLGRMSL